MRGHCSEAKDLTSSYLSVLVTGNNRSTSSGNIQSASSRETVGVKHQVSYLEVLVQNSIHSFCLASVLFLLIRKDQDNKAAPSSITIECSQRLCQKQMLMNEIVQDLVHDHLAP